MKYLLSFIAFLIGSMISDSLTGTEALGWIIGGGSAFLVYIIYDFIKYTKSSPKDLLKFHGELLDPPLARSKSINELMIFVEQLHDGGLIKDFNPMGLSINVNGEQWSLLSDVEKNTFLKILAQVMRLNLSATGTSIHGKEIEVQDEDSIKTLAQQPL